MPEETFARREPTETVRDDHGAVRREIWALDADERTSWDILTERFRRLYARHAAGGGADG